MRISALRRPCFYVRPQYTRRRTKSQARRHNPPRRRVCYTIAKLERREAGYESRSGTARRAAGACPVMTCPTGWGSTLPPTTPRCGQRRLRSGAASPPCTRMLPCGCAASARRCTGRCVPCWPATRPSATCGAGLPPGADTAAAEAKKTAALRSGLFCCAGRQFFAGGTLSGGCFYPPVWNCCKAPFSSRLTCA